MKLLLIDSRVSDIETIISAVNETTACIVFNYHHDTPETLLSKIRFLNKRNRVIRDNFYYEPPPVPVITDLSNCHTCDASGNPKQYISSEDIALTAMEYATTSQPSIPEIPNSNMNPSTPWIVSPVQIIDPCPVFFQRVQPITVTVADASGPTVIYREPLPVLVSELDEIYETFKTIPYESSPDVYDSTATTSAYTTFSTIGIIQHSYVVQSDSYTFLQFLSSNSGPAILKNVATDDPTLQTWESYISTITALLTRHQTQTLDLMACALYSDPNWKYVIDELQTRLAINVRASLDNTGYSSMGGNWILESDSVNLKDVYFTDAIDGWKYLLATITDTRFYTMQFNNSMYLTYPGSSTAVNVGTGDFTFETWYYETSKQTGCTIFDKGNYNYTWQIRNPNGTNDGLSLTNSNWNGGSGWLYANNAVVPVAQWSHLAVTRSGTTFKFYINGILMQTMTGPATLNNNGSNFSIGFQSPDNCFCNMLKTGTRLYDARMWNVCRTDSEIRMNRNRILPANTTGLVANYALTFPTSTAATAATTISDRTTNAINMNFVRYTNTWSNDVPVPNIGFYIENNYLQDVITEPINLVARYAFDSNSVTVDSSPNSNTLTNVGSVTFNTSEYKHGTAAASFNGSNYFEIVNDGRFSPDNFTIACWVNPVNSSGNIQSIATCRDGVSFRGWMIYINGNNHLEFWTGSGSSWYGNDITLVSGFGALNTWVHVAFTFTKSTSSLVVYINGNLTTTVSRTYTNNTTNNMRIGAGGDSPNQLMVRNGTLIDDFRFYNQVLTSSEVTAISRVATRFAVNYGDLTSTDFSGVNFTGVNFTSTTLTGSNFTNCNFTNATLANVTVDSSTNFTGANLTGITSSGIIGTPILSAEWMMSSGVIVTGLPSPTIGDLATIPTKTLGTDVSFSLTDPSSNSSRAFTYSSSNTSVATVLSTRKVWTMTRTSSAVGNFNLKLTANNTDIALHIDFRSDRFLLAHYTNGAWNGPGPGFTAEVFDFHNLPLPTIFTVEFDTTNFKITYGPSNRVLTYPNSLNVASINGISDTVTFLSNVIGTVTVQTIQANATLAGAGTSTITATQAADASYNSGSVSTTLTVNAILPTFGTFTLGPKLGSYLLADASFSLTAPTSDSSGVFSYTSDNSAVAVINPSFRITRSFDTTSTWVVPAGVTSVSALIVGGGGGGGRDMGGGGGAGGVIINTNIAVTPGASMNIVVGSGGNPPANSGLVASNGGNSSFAGLVAIGGGGGGSLTNTAGANGGSAGGRSGTTTNQSGTATTTPLQGNNGGGTSAFVGAGGGGGAGQVGGVSLGSNLGGKGGDGIANSITTSTVYYGGGGGGGGHGGIGGSGGIGGGGKGADNGGQSASPGTDGLGGGGGGGGGTITSGPGARGGSGIVIIFYASFITPSSITNTTTNLLARYDASVASGYTLSGSNVTQWNDLTGNGYHLTPNSTGPTLTTIKSVPAFNFNSGLGLIRASVPLTTPITMFMVATYRTATATWGNFMHHGQRDFDWSLRETVDTNFLNFHSNNDNEDVQLLMSNNTNYIWIGRIVGNTRQFWAYSETDSRFISGTPVTITPGNKTLYVGKSEVNEACNSSIGEILYYNASLSDADVSANLLYLQNKWFNNMIISSSGTYGTQVNLVGNGTANITATQDACGNYLSKSTSSLLTVGGNQVASTLASSTFSVATNKTLADSSFAITTRPTSNSDGAIMYSSSNTNVATIDSSGNFINIIGLGDVSFNATQAATTQYLSSIKTSNTLTVSKATPVYQSISQVTKIIGVDVSFSLSAIMVGAASTSNGAYTFSSPGETSTTILSTDNMNNVTGALNHTQYQSNLKLGVGGDLVGWSESGLNHFVDLANTAGQTNTPNYAIMFWDTYTITQTTAVSDSNTLNTIYTVNFKAGPAVYSTPSQATGATASDGIVFDILRSNDTVLATSTYLPGAWAGYPTLTSRSFTYTGDGTGNIRVRIKPVASGTGRFFGCVDDVVISSTVARYVSISGDVATILEYTPSAITITASQAATTLHNAGSTSFNLLVAYGSPSYQVIPQVTKTFGVDASFSLSAIMTGISSSDGSYTFSSASDAISISGGIATINAYTPSAVTITASQNAALNYNPGTTTFSLLISRRTPSLSSATFTVPSPKLYGDASFSVFTRPVSDNSGAITYTSSNTSVATIDASGNFITIVGPGDVSFNATQAETSLFNAATRTSNTLTVSKITISLAFVNPPTTKNVTDAAFTVTATGARPDAVTYSSSDLARATVDSSTGLVTLKGAGTVIITASQASTEFYNVSTATCSIVIASAGTTLQGQDISSNTSFASVDLSGASLVGTTVSGVSFSSANLSNVDFSGAVITGTNFSNANISGARNLPAFSTVQKLQLLKNINNAGVGAVQMNAPISGADINSLLATPNNEVSAATFTVKAPTAVDASANKIVTVSSEDIAGNKSIYIPINENETVKLNNVVYSFNGTNLLDASGNVVTFLITQNTPFKIYAGSIVGLNIQNTLNRITILGDGLYNILHEILQPKAV